MHSEQIGRHWKEILHGNQHWKLQVLSSNESLRIEAGNRELKIFGHFNYVGSVLTMDGFGKGIQDENYHYPISINSKISLLISKLHIELRNKLVMLMFRALHVIAQRPGN